MHTPDPSSFEELFVGFAVGVPTRRLTHHQLRLARPPTPRHQHPARRAIQVALLLVPLVGGGRCGLNGSGALCVSGGRFELNGSGALGAGGGRFGPSLNG